MTKQFDMVAAGHLIAGVDEVGRGPLAGPVVACAVILDPNWPIAGLADSKALSAGKRERLALAIKEHSLAWALGWSSEAEIDEINILQASLLAMQRAVQGLAMAPQHVQVDGNKCPRLNCSVEAIVKGDQTVPAISAASIVAKVTRDQFMVELDTEYPGYGFAKHKGYPSKEHFDSLQRLGPSAVHRRSFGPVRAVLRVSAQ